MLGLLCVCVYLLVWTSVVYIFEQKLVPKFKLHLRNLHPRYKQ
jgi:hypothetical protein